MPTVVFGENTGDDYTAVTEDAWTNDYSSNDTVNYGSDVRLRAKDTGDGNINNFPRIRWDVSDIAGATINSASITVTKTNYQAPPRTHYFHEDLKELVWVESEITDDQPFSGGSWGADGGTLDGTDVNGTVNSSTGSIGSYNHNSGSGTNTITGLASSLSGQLAGGTYGIVISQTSGGAKNNDIASSEGTDGERPYLTVDYTAAGGAAAFVPPRVLNLRRQMSA